MAAGGQNPGPAEADLIFRANKQWPSEHLFYLENLTANNVSAKDIKQVGLHGRPGWVAVTMASQASRDDVVSNGVSIAGKPVDLFIGDGSATSIHVFGCPVSLRVS